MQVEKENSEHRCGERVMENERADKTVGKQNVHVQQQLMAKNSDVNHLMTAR